MSGHSKWATTKRAKAVVDAKRGAIFTKLANVIIIAAKKGGDPDTNASLRSAIEKARAANMPKDNIERSIKKGTGELAGAAIEELFYEAVGPGNSQFVVKCLTDNKNRSAATVRHAFSKFGGSLGAVMWNFEQQGVVMVAKEALGNNDFDELEMLLIDAGAIDIKNEDEGLTVYTNPEDLQKIKDVFESKSIAVESAETEHVAKTRTKLSEDDLRRNETIAEDLDDNEDVSDYYINWD